MKRKLISVFMFLLIGFILMGCDLFGTQSTTTTQPTGTYYDVVFYDGDGSILDTQEVLEGESADNPGTPTKAATAQYTYTFDHWDQDYSNVTSDLVISPIFTTSINQYTVTFYDEDGTTVLGTSTVAYGSAATAPADPTKPSDEEFNYTFNGWNADFSNVTSDLTIIATYAAHSLDAFTVTFVNYDGTSIDVQAVDEGGDAIAPADPTRPSDNMYDYTFNTWDIDFTNVQSDLTVTATYTRTLRQFTVTFYNADGAVLSTQTVTYGSAATAPATPTMPPTEDYLFTFNGWDTTFGVITSNKDVTATYVTTWLNEQALLGLVIMLFDPEDPEAFIEMLIDVLEMDDELELYDVLLTGFDAFTALQTVDSAADLQAVYTSLADGGITKDRIINMLYFAMLTGMTNDLGYYSEEIDMLEDDILSYQQSIVDAEAQLTAISQTVSDYCALQTGIETVCQEFFNTQVEVWELQSAYYHMFDQEFPEEFNWGLYYELEWKLDNILYVLLIEENPTGSLDLQTQYDAMVAQIPTEEFAMYQPMLDAYYTYKQTDYNNWMNDYSALHVDDAAMEYQVIDFLNMMLWGYWNEYDEEIWGYNQYFNDIDFMNWLIMEAEWRIEDLERDLVRTQAIVNFLSDAQGEIEAKTAFGTAYDMLEAVILQLDEDTFEFVYDLIMENLPDQAQAEARFESEEDEEPIQTLLALFTAENITFIADKLSDILSAAFATLDTADYDNLKATALHFIEEMMTEQGVPEVDRLAMISNLNTAIDRYILYFQFASAELVGFLESIDLAKAEVIAEIPYTIMTMQFDEITMAIEISRIVEALIGDDSLDVNTLLQYLSAIYFDVTNGFMADPTYVSTIQGLIDTFMTDYMALVAIVKDYDTVVISPSEVEDVYDLVARTMAIGSWFAQGFEAVENPIEAYQGYMIEEIIYSIFGGEDASGTITMIMGILGTPDEETTFYYVRSIFQYVMGVRTLRSFEDLQYWVGSLESFGFTQEQLIGYALDILEIASEDFVDGSQEFQDYIDYLEGQITYYQSEVGRVEALVTELEVQIGLIITGLDPSLQANAQAYWDAKLAYELAVDKMAGSYDEMIWFFGSEDALAYSLIIEAYVNAMYADPFDQGALDLAEADFNALLDMWADDTYAVYLLNNYFDAYDTFIGDDLEANMMAIADIVNVDPLYSPFIGMVPPYIQTYINYVREVENYLQMIENYEDEIDWMMEDLFMNQVIYDLMHDPTLKTDTAEVIGILIDELQNMIGSMPSDSFELIESLVQMAMNDGEVEYIPTAQELLDFAGDLSAFLKLRGDSLTTDEIDALEAFILQFITLFVDQLPIDPLDKPALVTFYNTLALKYIGFADDALTEVTDILDSLTLADVELIIQFIQMLTSDGDNLFMTVIIGAQAINAAYDPATVDLHLILNMLNEVYFDIAYQGDYDPLDLAAVQAGWEAHLDSVIALIATVATYDPYNLDPLTFGTILELQESIEFMHYLFEHPEEVLNSHTFGYEYQDFVNLVYRLFDDVNESNVDARIEQLCNVFDLTAADHEEVYYYVLAIGDMIRSLDEPDSIFEVLGILKGVLAFGFTHEEVAVYVVNAVQIFLLPNLPDMYDTSGLEDDLADWQGMIDTSQSNINDLDAIVHTEISAIVDPGAQQAAWDLWDKYHNSINAEQQLAFYINNVYMFTDYFDWGLWDELCGFVEDGNWGSVNDRLSEYEYWQADLYYWLLDMYQYKLNCQNELDIAYNDFQSNYGDVTVTYRTDLGYYMTDLFNAVRDDMYWVVYDRFNAEFWYWDVEWQLQEAEQQALILHTIENFFLITDADLLAEDFLTIVLEELDAYAHDPNVEAIDFLLKVIGRDPFEIGAQKIATELNVLGAFLSTTLFSTIDAADEVVITSFLNTVIEAFVVSQELDPADEADAIAFYQGFVNTYLLDLMDLPGVIGGFFQTLTEAKVQTVMDQIMILSSIPNDDELSPEEVDYYNIVRAVAIANIIATLELNTSIDLEEIYIPLVGIIYDLNEANGVVYDDDLATMLGDLDTIVAAVVSGAPAVALIDPNDMDILDQATILGFKTVVEELTEFIDTLVPHEEETPE